MPNEIKVKKIGKILHVYNTVKDMELFNHDLLGMIEHSYDALCIADGESRILLLNEAFEKVMGIPIRDIIGKRIIDLVAAGVTDTSATQKVLESGKQETVIINSRAGRQVLSTGVPVYGQDHRIKRVFCNLRDVTDLVRLREEFEISQRLASKYLLELQERKKSDALRSRIVTRNPAMRQVMDLIYRMAHVESSILILGESGVGKDLLAKMVHEASPRSETGSFVKVNCGAIPESLLESEFFGYVPGAFTGASSKGKIGYFETADKGTMFLDEIGELPLQLQVKLLSVLQDRKVTRVGGSSPFDVDIRVVAATNRDLDDMVRAGKFREDLYYRLNVVPVRVPPLRDRGDDIPMLLIHFLEEFNRKYGLHKRFGKEAVDSLCSYSWPGNIRELMNLVERVAVTTEGDTIDVQHLPALFHAGNAREIRLGLSSGRTLRQTLEEFEENLISDVVADAATREEAAHLLGISLSTLTRRLRRKSRRHN
ncbi:MAG TPA: sigma 54-interacting transcriptional regulator [Desulfobacteraceae bacterium]|nr:sigma 54-interacting transcriptional regulator [Desulfobacteraceae bacterium]HPQ27973.1 sigma 54-interacting transcriptional regulator [Desulfobacteraceae bacterium]